MLHKEWIEYLIRENKSENCDQIINYYMPRKLRRFIQIDRKLLETKKDDKIKEEKVKAEKDDKINEEKAKAETNDKIKEEKVKAEKDDKINEEKVNDFIIVHTEEEFNEKCSQSHPQVKNVHYLIEDQNQFKWQKSNGPISTLKKYLIMNKKCEESIDEGDILNKNDEKVLIISAEPGMGKSLILDHFTQNSKAENFLFIKIILNTCTKTLSATNFKKRLQNREDDLIEFVLKSLLGKTDEQEISLLKHLAKEEKLILMFDGLDEVNDYKQQVIQLIDVLVRDCKLKKILITTRNQLREELEDHFSTFSFNLNNFDEEDQKNFLAKYWNNLNLKNPPRPTSANKLMQTAEVLIERIKSISSQNLNQLIGIPLQTKMLADIYFEKMKNKEDSSDLILTNISVLYNEFIESKIKIQFKRTNNNIEIEQLSKEIQKIVLEVLETKFYSDHTKLSSLILFKQNNQNKIDLEFDEKDKVQAILEYGVIVAFKNGIPTFLHQSFAEFFLAKSCLQKIKEQNKDDDKELEQILRDKIHFLVRKFLNDLMENVHSHKKQEENKYEENEDFNQEIGNCCVENLIHLLKYLVEDKGANLKTKNEFLIIATRNGHKDILAFLLENGIDVNQQDKYGETALMWASQKGHKEIVQMLLQHENIEINTRQDNDGRTALMWASLCDKKEIVEIFLQEKNIEINQRDKKFGETALMKASSNGHKDIVQILLQDKNIQINKQNNDGRTALMHASHKGHNEIVEMLLQNENIEINQQDKYGWTALMWASREGNKEIVKMLLQDENIKINTRQDNDGRTALMWASQQGHKEIVKMLLQDKRIEINQQDKWEGNTVLMWASRNGHKEIVEMLLQDERIEINLQNKDGYTALMWASEVGHTEIVEMLLQNKNIQINQLD
jgi:ankyrin repeat protein